MKNNNYKTFGVIIILIIVGVFYFNKDSGNQKPKSLTSIFQTSKNTENLQSECALLGIAAKNSYEAKYNPNDYTMMDSTFHYNSRLHECLWGREIISHSQPGESFNTYKGITNLYSSKDILYAFKFYSGDSIPKLEQAFSAINYIDWPNEQGGNVIKSEAEFEALYNKTLTE